MCVCVCAPQLYFYLASHAFVFSSFREFVLAFSFFFILFFCSSLQCDIARGFFLSKDREHKMHRKKWSHLTCTLYQAGVFVVVKIDYTVILLTKERERGD